MQREAARLRGERGEQISEIAWSNLLISEARLDVLQIKKTFQEEILSELCERRKERAEMAERISAARRSLETMEIRAPADGAVVGLQVHTVGQVIEPGETLMEIMPRNHDLIVEARVRTADIDNVTVGLPAEVQLTAVSQGATPRLRGRLIYLSADSLVDARSGQAYVLARIAVGEDETTRLGDRALRSGMPADVFIRTDQRTPLEDLLQPITDSLFRAWRES